MSKNMYIESIAIKVPIKKGEGIRRYLLERKLLREDLKIERKENHLLLPIKNLDEDITFPIVKEKFRLYKQKITSYKSLLPHIASEKLPTSYDIIGDIILIKIPRDLMKYRYEIGEALLKSHPHIKTVCNIQPVSGELRIRDIEVIAGEDSTETIHREYGVSIHLDVRKTFYSPRLATERKRIASLVEDGEIILDMFTGVAPFPILIARYANPRKIYAIDKNREAIFFAKKNVYTNKVEDIVEVIHGDSQDILKILGDIRVERVIMNLPFSAYKFFPYALEIIKPRAVIHYYDILKDELLEDRKKELIDIASKHRYKLYFNNIRRIKTYAPREFYIGMDITALYMKPM